MAEQETVRMTQRTTAQVGVDLHCEIIEAAALHCVSVSVWASHAVARALLSGWRETIPMSMVVDSASARRPLSFNMPADLFYAAGIYAAQVGLSMSQFSTFAIVQALARDNG